MQWITKSDEFNKNNSGGIAIAFAGIMMDSGQFNLTEGSMRAADNYNPRLDLHSAGRRTTAEKSNNLFMTCIANGFEASGAIDGGVIVSKGGVDVLLLLDSSRPRFRVGGIDRDVFLGDDPDLWFREIVLEVKSRLLPQEQKKSEWDLARVISCLVKSRFKVKQSTDCHYLLQKKCRINLYVGRSPRIHIDGTRRSLSLPEDLSKWAGYIEATHDSSVSRIQARAKHRKKHWNPWDVSNWN